MAQKSWTEADFQSLSWHDNHVHALEIRAATPDHGTGELVLHLDHILEWLPPVDGKYLFRVAPAVLTFKEIFGLRLELDYTSVQAGMTPFSIGNIDREQILYPTGHVSFRWTIQINWPAGAITFEAPAFAQELVGESVTSSTQALSRAKRLDLGGV